MTTPKLTFEATQYGFDLDAPIGGLKHINLHYGAYECGCCISLRSERWSRCATIIDEKQVTVRGVIERMATHGIQSECRIHSRFVGIRPMTGGSEYDYVVVYGSAGDDPSDGTGYILLLLIIAALIIAHIVR